MAYTDLDSIHSPTSGNRAPAAWGAAVNANMDHLNDNVLAKLGVWTSYTPTVYQPGSIAYTLNYCRYFQLGRLVVYSAYLSITGSGTGGSVIAVSVPKTAANGSNLAVGEFYYYDASTATNYSGVAILRSTTSLGFLVNQAGEVGNSPNIAAASGDLVRLSVMYESVS